MKAQGTQQQNGKHNELDIEPQKLLKLNNREKLDIKIEPQEIVRWDPHNISKMYVI